MDGHWAAAAAGHVERGETAYDAAHREALEELGVSDLDLDFEFTMQRTQFAEPIDERVDFFFTARSWSGEPRIVEPEKCAELRWCLLDDLPDPVVPHEAYALPGSAATALPAPYTPSGSPPREAARSTESDESSRGRHADDLGPMPEPTTEEPELNPGGVDAIADDGATATSPAT